jgi:hypothetical protein
MIEVAAPAPSVITLQEAVRRTSFGTPRAFHRWAAHMGLRSLSGAKGRYSVAALDAAIERASRISRRRA